MKVRPEFTFSGLPNHRGDDLPTDDEAAQVCSTGFLYKLLRQDVRVEPPEGLDHALSCILSFGEYNANTLSSLKQLDDHRRTATEFDQVR